jgi:hypothetical protein
MSTCRLDICQPKAEACRSRPRPSTLSESVSELHHWAMCWHCDSECPGPYRSAADDKQIISGSNTRVVIPIHVKSTRPLGKQGNCTPSNPWVWGCLRKGSIL